MSEEPPETQPVPHYARKPDPEAGVLGFLGLCVTLAGFGLLATDTLPKLMAIQRAGLAAPLEDPLRLISGSLLLVLGLSLWLWSRR